MNKELKYINIHTHTAESEQSDAFSIVSLMVGDSLAYAEHSCFSMGIHPWQLEKQHPEELYKLLLQPILHPKLCAIGEAGLDRSITTPIEIQKIIFEKQIQLAERLQLPFIIHAIKTISEILAFRKKYPKGCWILHGFRGNAIQAVQCIQQSIHLSFGHHILHDSDKLINALKSVPLNRIFFETDTAKITIAEVYQKVSILLDIEIDILCKTIAENFNNCFKLKIHG